MNTELVRLYSNIKQYREILATENKVLFISTSSCIRAVFKAIMKHKAQVHVSTRDRLYISQKTLPQYLELCIERNNGVVRAYLITPSKPLS